MCDVAVALAGKQLLLAVAVQVRDMIMFICSANDRMRSLSMNYSAPWACSGQSDCIS